MSNTTNPVDRPDASQDAPVARPEAPPSRPRAARDPETGRFAGSVLPLEDLSVIDSLTDERLFARHPAFRGDLESWANWIAFLKAIYGLPLDESELATFSKHTGRSAPRDGGYPEAVAQIGVQSGKTEVMGIVAAYELSQAVSRGERDVHVPLLAQDARGAMRALFAALERAVESSPYLSQRVTRRTMHLIEFSGGVTGAVYPCRPSSIRGIRARVVLIDEIAHFVAPDTGLARDVEMLRAARGRVATTGGKVVVASSPYAASGALYDLHRRHFAGDTATLVWQAAAGEMNPTLSAGYLERMRDEDPEAYRSEVLGEFRSGTTSLLDGEVVDGSVMAGIRERAPEPGVRYLAFADASSGKSDAFTLAVAHWDEEAWRTGNDAKAVLDCLWAMDPPFDPLSEAVPQLAAILKRYGCGSVEMDRFAEGFVRDGLRQHGIEYRASARDRSAIYLEAAGYFNSDKFRILDDRRLSKELRGLERRRGSGGRDRVDHRRGFHDDRANSACGALVLAADFGAGPGTYEVDISWG